MALTSRSSALQSQPGRQLTAASRDGKGQDSPSVMQASVGRRYCMLMSHLLKRCLERVSRLHLRV